MDATQYRIVQTGDSTFMVERMCLVTVWGKYPWSKHTQGTKWVPAEHPPPTRRFCSQEAAQKWINDKRTYPIVVKEPA
jgi:hypothetical protein